MKPCPWCGKTEQTDDPHKGFCSHECWYEAMGHYGGWDNDEDIEIEEE